MEVQYKKWQIIYPIYLDKSFDRKHGRRVSLENALDNPTCEDIQRICQYYNLECKIEPLKKHPCNPLLPGRVRVKLHNDDRTPINPEIPNKKTLLRVMGKQIPLLKRTANPKKPARKRNNKKKRK